MGAAAILALSACNDTGTTTATNSDTTKMGMNPGDTTVTTTTTTTTKTFHAIPHFENRTFYNVATHKPVKLRMDTVLHYYVDVVTNKEPDYYYYDPSAKDTFDYYGRRLNNALMNNNGTWTVDETRIMNDDMGTSNGSMSNDNSNMSTDTMSKMNNDSKMKMKVKDDKTKMKTKNDK